MSKKRKNLERITQEATKASSLKKGATAYRIKTGRCLYLDFTEAGEQYCLASSICSEFNCEHLSTEYPVKSTISVADGALEKKTSYGCSYKEIKKSR